MTKNQLIHGWRLAEKRYLRAEKWTAYKFVHEATGAEYLHIDNDFSDKAIAITLKTCPSDHSGVAHILEHTALTGSEKYPLRDPFFSMFKQSLQSFMNAFTAEDWTAYLFSSQYDRDLMNLLAVYLDAVYFPRLERLSFLQEGWRYEPRAGGLGYAGVVYNEMKGSLSSPERLMQEYIKEGLFPESLYRFNSGGRPENIPDLSYAAFRKFHADYYHPSNTLVYSFGALDPKKVMRYIDEHAFCRFRRKRIDSAVRRETRWRRPRKAVKRYADEGGGSGAQALSAWLLNPAADVGATLFLEFVSELLIGEASAPLKQALLASGLGTDMADGSGVTADYKNVIFACGLKGVPAAKTGKAISLVRKELAALAAAGFSQEDIRAAWNKLEFKYREVSNQPYPYGIKQYLNLITPWRHDSRRVLDHVGWSGQFDAIRERSGRNSEIRRMIRRAIISNRHRLDLELRPDAGLLAEQARAEARSLAAAARRLDPAQKEEIARQSRALRAAQEEKEDLGCLPALPLKSIPRRIKTIREIRTDRVITAYPLATGGFSYVIMAFSLARLSQEESLLLPFLSYVLPQIGTRQKGYEEYIRAVSTYTGGIKVFPWAELGQDGLARAYLLVKGKAVNRHFPKLLSLCQEIFTQADFAQPSRISQYLKELEAKMCALVVQEGHYYALSASARGLDPAQRCQEDWYGLSQIRYLKSRLKEKSQEAVVRDLARLHAKLFAANQARIGLAAEKSRLKRLAAGVQGLSGELGLKPGGGAWEHGFKEARYFEGYLASTAASFVGASQRAVDIRHQDAAALLAAVKLLSRNQIHRLVREQGGAYGGFASYDHFSGLVQFGSYRDPHLRATLEAFKQAARLMAKAGISREDLKSAQLMVIADMDKPQTPAEAGEQAFVRRLIGLEAGKRQKFRDSILDLRQQDIASAAEKYLLPAAKNPSVAVISSREKLASANKEKGRRFVLKKI